MPESRNRRLPENCQSDLYAVRRCAPPARTTPVNKNSEGRRDRPGKAEGNDKPDKGKDK
jgi:hypothetical protein